MDDHKPVPSKPGVSEYWPKSPMFTPTQKDYINEIVRSSMARAGGEARAEAHRLKTTLLEIKELLEGIV